MGAFASKKRLVFFCELIIILKGWGCLGALVMSDCEQCISMVNMLTFGILGDDGALLQLDDIIHQVKFGGEPLRIGFELGMGFA